MHSQSGCLRRLWVMSHLSTVALVLSRPEPAYLPGLACLPHRQPSRPVPDGVGQFREQLVSIQGPGWGDGEMGEAVAVSSQSTAQGPNPSRVLACRYSWILLLALATATNPAYARPVQSWQRW
jgi:hypothetical protein